MYYKAVKESDGTYTIRESLAGGNYSVILSGVRGSNVSRTIDRLRSIDNGRLEPAISSRRFARGGPCEHETE